MKKISCLLLLYLIAMNHWCFIFAQVNISSEYFGTYIPVEFGKLLNETNSYSKSLENSSKTYHDILFVGNNGIFSDLKFHDGYKVSNGNKYEFYDKDSCKYVIDDKKNIYKAIYIGNTEKNYQVFYEYVINSIFKNLKEVKNINIEGNTITINDKKLFFIPDLMFFDNENCDAWFYSLEDKGKKRNYYALIKDGISARFIEGIKDENDFGWIPGTKVIFEFPIFYYGGDDYLSYKVEKLSRSEIRLLRNMIYAKHGYQFKDKKLLNIFNNFSWYKINPSFTENELSKQEVEFIQRCKLLEAKTYQWYNKMTEAKEVLRITEEAIEKAPDIWEAYSLELNIYSTWCHKTQDFSNNFEAMKLVYEKWISKGNEMSTIQKLGYANTLYCLNDENISKNNYLEIIDYYDKAKFDFEKSEKDYICFMLSNIMLFDLDEQKFQTIKNDFYDNNGINDCLIKEIKESKKSGKKQLAERCCAS